MKLTVSEIWRYPVKSMQGEKLASAFVDERGIHLDRGWAVRVDETRTIRGARYLDGLLDCSARYLQGTSAGLVPHAAITLPTNETLNTDDSRIHARLSEIVGKPVTLWPLQPTTDLEHYRINKPEPESYLAEIRRVMDLRPEDPLPDVSRMPKALLRELTIFSTPVGTYFDAFPLNVLTEASLRRLKRIRPDTQIDTRRFRPNLLVADSENDDGTLEAEWVGRTLRAGDLEIDVISNCPRCGIITKPQPGIEKAPSLMRTVVKEFGQNLSVYCDVRGRGEISTGQSVMVAEG